MILYISAADRTELFSNEKCLTMEQLVVYAIAQVPTFL